MRATRTGLPCTLVLLSGCVRTLELPADTISDEVVSSIGDTGSADSGTPLDAERVCVPAEADGFLIPHGRWALAVLHASRRYGDLSDSALSLSPAWFLASAWESTYFDCAAYGLPWSPDEAPDAEGCMAINETSMWSELSRFFPAYYDEGSFDGAVDGDHVEAAVMAMTWFTMAGHVLIQKRGVNPEEWYASADDPRAVEKLSAIMHAHGPWSSQLSNVLNNCRGAGVADCIADNVSGNTAAHLDGVIEKIAALEAGSCYDEPVTEDEVNTYIDELSRAWPEAPEAWDEARAAALAARTGEGFATEAPRILDAIDGALVTRLLCPEEVLWDQFRLSCP